MLAAQADIEQTQLWRSGQGAGEAALAASFTLCLRCYLLCGGYTESRLQASSRSLSCRECTCARGEPVEAQQAEMYEKPSKALSAQA